jgi:ProP effector
MSKTARRARIAAVIELLCGRFPQAFSRHTPRPLKVGVYADVLAALDGVQPRDLQPALRAYTSNARYLRALSAGACRIDLDGKPAGTVTPEDEKLAKARLADKKGASPRAQVPPTEQAGPEAPAMRAAEENQKPSAPKRLSLADLRGAGRRRREAAA